MKRWMIDAAIACSTYLIILEDEEREILEVFDNETQKQADVVSVIKNRHQTYANAMFKKDTRINICKFSRESRGLQKKALTEIIPS